jgi:hypothetical protein
MKDVSAPDIDFVFAGDHVDLGIPVDQFIMIALESIYLLLFEQDIVS